MNKPRLVLKHSEKPSKLQPKLVKLPIPPTLLHSPLLFSPHSIFQQDDPGSYFPSLEDEEWLRDTVPLKFNRELVKKGENEEAARVRSAPPSPPLVRPSTTMLPPSKFRRLSAMSIAHHPSQSYFIMTFTP